MTDLHDYANRYWESLSETERIVTCVRMLWVILRRLVYG